MPLELTHTYTLSRKAHPSGDTFERTASPKGTFNITVRKTDYRYYLDVDGEMTFVGEDFVWIVLAMEEDNEFFITCDFKGVEWKGYFTQTDCVIHRDKKYITVTPTTDDSYRNFEPYMDLEMNILPSRGGFHADTEVEAIRMYRRDRVKVTIDEPYDGNVAAGKQWEGYSVNDWVGGNEGAGSYGYTNALHNSLIHYIARNYEHAFTLYNRRTHVNQLYWIDYTGYLYRDDEYLTGVASSVCRIRYLLRLLGVSAHNWPDCYALVGVVNHYDENKQWTTCELIYEREIYEGRGKPKGIIHPHIDALYSLNAEEFAEYADENIPGGIRGWAIKRSDEIGWIYVPQENQWRRYPKGLGYRERESSAPRRPFRISEENAKLRARTFGDGYWYSELSDYIESGDGYIRKQVLSKNLKYADPDVYGVYGQSEAEQMYIQEYGKMNIKGRYHRIESLVNKFLHFIQEEGGRALSLSSKYITNGLVPIPTMAGVNPWRDALLGHFSDIKRPESSEKADKEEMNFHDFLNTICGFSNAGWAVAGGKFYLEHALFFESGFRYPTAEELEESDDDDDVVGLPEAAPYINPQDIYNYAKNMNFLGMSNEIRYNRPDMQKYEKFILAGGEQPRHHKTQITYTSPLVNNLPGQNIRETTLERIATDFDWIMTEAPESGLGIVFCTLTGMTPTEPGGLTTGREVYFTMPRGGSVQFNIDKGEDSANRTFARGDVNLGEYVSQFKNEFNTDPLFGTLKIIDITTLLDDHNFKFRIQHDDHVEVEQPTQSNSSGGAGFASNAYSYVYTGDVATYEYEIPFVLDEFFRYKVNEATTLADIVERFHWYGRSFDVGFINFSDEETQFVTRPYILQDIFFRYREDINPYSLVVTENGWGIIQDASFNAMTGIFKVTIGYRKGKFINIDLPEFDPLPIGFPILGIYFHRHVQQEPSDEWTIIHGLNTDAIFRPVVYAKEHDQGWLIPMGDDDDESGEMREIEYHELQCLSDHVLKMRFTKPVSGEAYFLSFEAFNKVAHYGQGDSWNISHDYNSKNVAPSIIWAESRLGKFEIRHDEFEIVDYMSVQFNFSAPTEGTVYIAELSGNVYLDAQEDDDDEDVPLVVEEYNIDGTERSIDLERQYPLKPIILRVDKEIGYNVTRLEELLLRIGFTKEVIAKIIVMQHD